MLQKIIFRLRLTWRLIRDPRVEFYKKLIPFLGIVYIVSPLDFIPDIFLIVGQLDDIGVILLGIRLFELSIPKSLIEEHIAILKGQMDDDGYKIPIRDYKVIKDKDDE